jgi:predicted transcriptional regulator
MNICKTDRKLLQTLSRAPGNQYPSKSRLIIDAEVNYRLASRRIKLLVKKGLIRIRIKVDRPGYAHQVTLIRRKLPEEI